MPPRLASAYHPAMARLRIPALLALATALALPAAAIAAGPPFPDPVNDVAVYDTAGALAEATETELERRIDEIEARTGAEVVVYTQVKPFVGEDENLADARALMDQWGIGRSGFDDGLVLMIGLDEDLVHGKVSLFAGSGYTSAYLDEDDLKAIIDADFVPPARNGDLDAAVLQTMEAIDAATTPQQRDRLNAARRINAVLGLVGAPLALLGVAGSAWLSWRREGDDPDVIDSPSILMAGPPAGMTPALATVVREGRATRHSLNVTLLELASTGRIGFANLDNVRSARSDADADPETDPAIHLLQPPPEARELSSIAERAYATLRQLARGDQRISRSRLWALNDALSETSEGLEREAVRLGWLTREPTPIIRRRMAVAGLWLAAGIGAGALGVILPSSGFVMVGIALGIGALVTFGFARAMSKRTTQGGIVDAMLKAYRRTLAKTMAQSRSMDEVAAEPTVAMLADTPDSAVVWGIALGLHDELRGVLERTLADAREAGATRAGGYYPTWLGSSTGATYTPVEPGMLRGGGGLFSGSPVPDIGGMFDALGSMGSTPPSTASSSSGGGFSGGGSSGGGGASGSF